jgi:putative FmdB family regulatory protein
MPFYEYECSSCKFYTEVMQKITDTPLAKCPSCGKKALVKLISAPNFRLKGGGWYETDFKDDKEGKRNLAGNDDEPAPKSDSEKGVEAKGDAVKADSSKPEAAKTEASKPEPKVEPKPAPSKRKIAARTAKSPARASAPKSKPAPPRASSKGKATKSKPARKKARR